MFSFGNIDPRSTPSDLSPEDERRHLYASIFIPLVFVALLWIIRLFEMATGISLVKYGIHPRHLDGLPGILFCPLIHGDMNHLISNSIPFFILGFLMLFTYRKVAFKAFVFIYLASDIMVWLIGRDTDGSGGPTYHIGASNIVYGFAFFIFFSGIFRKNIQSIALSLLIVFMYGAIVWGMFPIDFQISWEGHLMGAVAGSVMAFVYRKVDLPPEEPEEEDDDDDDFSIPETGETEIHYHLKNNGEGDVKS